MVTHRNRPCRAACIPGIITAMAASAAAQPCLWSALGDGHATMVHALAVFDDGAGKRLYAGLSGTGVARWDGQSWSTVGGFNSGTVVALTVFDDGGGAALYAGGAFQNAGAAPAVSIARWDGQSWSAVGGGMGGGFARNVGALAVFDDGTGEALYAGGNFTEAGGAPANRIARWDGQSWSPLGAGIEGMFIVNINAMASFNNQLYIGGIFTTAGGSPAANIARWNGQSWNAVGSGTDGIVVAMATFDDGAGSSLFVGGSFDSAGGLFVNRIARWDGELWWDVQGGVTSPGAIIPPAVNALAIFDQGAGPRLIAAGEFQFAGSVETANIASWDGTTWTPLGDGVNNGVNDLTVDEGALHVGGSFTQAGGTSAFRIATWSCESPCYADCDDNGTLNIDDFLCFIDAFAQSDPYADCDDNGLFNIDDFLCFINAFAAGCP